MAYEDTVDAWFEKLDLSDCEAIVDLLGALDETAIENKHPLYNDQQRKLINEASELLASADDDDENDD